MADLTLPWRPVNWAMACWRALVLDLLTRHVPTTVELGADEFELGFLWAPVPGTSGEQTVWLRIEPDMEFKRVRSFVGAQRPADVFEEVRVL